LAEQFAELFDSAELAAVLAEFSPPCTLAQFTNSSLHSLEQQRVRLRMVARLLRDELIMQLHTFLYLLPPFSNEPVDVSAPKLLEDVGIRNMIMSAPMTNEIKGTVAKLCISLLSNSTREQVESTLAVFIGPLQSYILRLFFVGYFTDEDLSHLPARSIVLPFLSSPVWSQSDPRKEILLYASVHGLGETSALLPFLNGEHHVEDIMYRMNLERSVVVRVLDTFASVLATFSRPDFITQ
uniref:LisH domain-containing protein n=1 Tax=Toxocara canis TaxID=6265 RepID=A0A183UT73_TOXCA